MPQTIIAANWKMNKTISQAQEFINEFKQNYFPPEREIVICGPYTLLHVLKNNIFKSGAENMHYAAEGAYTGEISAGMIKDCGCEYVIIGHSERRQLFSETDEAVNKKLKTALATDLIPIFCIGETLEQREGNQIKQVITRQVETGLEGIDDISKIVVAYEPIWAIGTGKTATPEQAQEIHALIRKLTSENTSILYGGSVKPNNVKELMAQADINGTLVGGASLEAESFSKIINY